MTPYKHRYLVYVCLSFFSLFGNHAMGNRIEYHQLDNGLTIVVIQNKQLTQLYLHTIIQTGASQDPRYKTGLANFTQQLLVSSNSASEAQPFKKAIEMLGGSEDCHAFYDYVDFGSISDTTTLNQVLKIHAQLLQPIQIDQTDLSKQKKQLLMQRSQHIEHDMIAKITEANRASAYLTGPYREPIIGWREDIESITQQDISTWHSTWYHPNNSTIFLSGPMDVETTLEAIEAHYGHLNQTTLPQYQPTDIRMTGNVSTLTSHWADAPYVLISYHIPSTDYQSLIMSQIASYLTQQYTDNQDQSNIVSIAKLPMMPQQYNGLFQLLVQLKPHASPISAIDEIQSVFDTLHSQSVKTHWLQSAKAYLLSHWLYTQSSPISQNKQQSHTIATRVDDPINHMYPSLVEQFDIDQLLALMSQYLTPNNRTITIMTPALKSHQRLERVDG
ncbi:MAG: hypothetical protein CMF46_05435 [Legionellales bacterium]|nr:hypothetical protein [Legionellales bacterium]|tara:strand:- start:1811 stop:3142 length:1332 start_codon:yes stop_codon:yes gene_type:complete